MSQEIDNQTYWKKGLQAENYDFMETVTATFGRDLVSQSNFPKTSSETLKVFDNASGAGAITSILYSEYSGVKKEVLGGDISEAMIAQFNKRASEAGWEGAKGEVMDAMDHKLPDEYFDYVFINFAVFGLPDPSKGLNECLRVSKPGGTISFTTWSHLGWVITLQTAVDRISSPAILPVDSIIKRTGDWNSPTYISSLLTSLGFKNIQVDLCSKSFPIDKPSWFVENVWKGMIHLLLAPWTDEQKKEYGDKLKNEWQKVLEELKEEGKEIKMEGYLCKGQKP